MPDYKGNFGNLMQHWTLCEILRIANNHARGLNYIDAHAMAPWATVRTEKSAAKQELFDCVRARVQGAQALSSCYKKAWRRLARGKEEGYPNSAAFVREVWKGDYSLLLCEVEPVTAAETVHWLIDVNELPACKRGELFPSDWRKRFETRLPSPSEVGLPADSLTLVSFDPYLISKNSPPTSKRGGGNVYPNDLHLIGSAPKGIDGGVLLQLSTYSTNGSNSQRAVIKSSNLILKNYGFTLVAQVPVNGSMMSLVYARNIPWRAELANLPSEFTQWKERIGKIARGLLPLPLQGIFPRAGK